MKAATRSGPSSSIFSASRRAARRPYSSGETSVPFSYQYGCSMCTMSGIGWPPWACMKAMPPRLAAATVLPW